MNVKPQLAGGFNDYLPADMVVRDSIFSRIKTVFERFGYVPLETPGIEREEILTGGDPNFSKTIFRIAGERDQPLALRFDLTVPLARVVAAYPELPKPFKRYQIGKVWRGEKPQAGRYREFTQFDADVVGSSSMMADAEIVAIMHTVMQELGFARYSVRVNNRKILNGLSAYAGFPDGKLVGVLRAIDKIDRDGWDRVCLELTRQPENTFDDAALALSQDEANRIKAFIDLRGSGHEEILAEVRSVMGASPIALQGASELEEMVGYVRSLAVPDDKWTIDLSVARGLGYYTGPVFETILLDLPEIGSVFSGGRFDGLVQNFSPNPVPATGASVGVDRLFAAMSQLELLPKGSRTTDVLVLILDQRQLKRYCELSTQLRAAGIKTEVYLGSERNIKGQLAYALKREIPLAVIAGGDEFSRNTVQLKNLTTRSQEEVPLDNLPDIVLNTLSAL